MVMHVQRLATTLIASKEKAVCSLRQFYNKKNYILLLAKSLATKHNNETYYELSAVKQPKEYEANREECC